MKKIICFVLLLSISLGLLAACAPAEDPGLSVVPPDPSDGQLESPPAQGVDHKRPDTAFRQNYTQLTVALLKKSVEAGPEENLLISPLSIQLALAMTANGANGQTKEEMEQLLGGSLLLEDLNAYLHTYVEKLPASEKAKLAIANSIWFRDEADRLTVKETFLQTNANYYGAEVFKRPFDQTTVKEINNWVDHNTEGMIDEILDQINDDVMMYLINAIAFDAEWAEPYTEFTIREGSFTDITGAEQRVQMMHGSEGEYLDDGKATGFVKPYSGGQYSFAVLLPNDGTDLYDYIDSMTAEGLAETLSKTEKCTVITQLPKFSYEYELTMNEILMEMGMPTAFNTRAADFANLGHSPDGNLYISNVLHKTFIQVDGMGTKAGAVTIVEMPAYGAYIPEPEVKEVIVDRPFVYMILDNETNLPLFIGCVTEITE